MLPDLRFLLGAALAIAVLAVAGVGMVASARLVHEAHMAPIEEARSLAYAGYPAWSQLSEGGGPQRFPDLIKDGASAPAVTRSEGTRSEGTQSEGMAQPEGLVAAVPSGPEAIEAASVGEGKPAPIVPALLDPPPSASAVEFVATTESTQPSTPAADASGPATQLASAPASPAADSPDEATAESPAQPQSAQESALGTAPPLPPSRPKPHMRRRLARARFRSFTPESQQAYQQSWQQTYQQTYQQTWQNPGFPVSNGNWPGYDSQFGPQGTGRKVAGKLAPGNRSQ